VKTSITRRKKLVIIFETDGMLYKPERDRKSKKVRFAGNCTRKNERKLQKTLRNK
jgi:hypothetical protein